MTNYIQEKNRIMRRCIMIYIEFYIIIWIVERYSNGRNIYDEVFNILI